MWNLNSKKSKADIEFKTNSEQGRFKKCAAAAWVLCTQVKQTYAIGIVRVSQIWTSAGSTLNRASKNREIWYHWELKLADKNQRSSSRDCNWREYSILGWINGNSKIIEWIDREEADQPDYI